MTTRSALLQRMRLHCTDITRRLMASQWLSICGTRQGKTLLMSCIRLTTSRLMLQFLFLIRRGRLRTRILRAGTKKCVTTVPTFHAWLLPIKSTVIFSILTLSSRRPRYLEEVQVRRTTRCPFQLRLRRRRYQRRPDLPRRAQDGRRIQEETARRRLHERRDGLTEWRGVRLRRQQVMNN